MIMGMVVAVMVDVIVAIMMLSKYDEKFIDFVDQAPILFVSSDIEGS